MNLLQDLQSSWADPQMRHALIVHWPVVLSALSAIFVLGLAISNGKNMALRITALCICLGVAVSGYLALNSGEQAENAANALSVDADRVLHNHEESGEKVPFFGALCAALVAITFVSKPAVRITAAWLAFAACAGTGVWVGNTAHLGGRLVYDFGVGTPFQGQPAADENGAAASGQSKDSFFAANVQPILADHCIKCHNPRRVADGKSGKLDQTSVESILKGGRTGPAIVPGKPEESLLIQRVRSDDESDEDRMPPPPNAPLTADQIAILEQWIRSGAD